jgi:hypothetical protein
MLVKNNKFFQQGFVSYFLIARQNENSKKQEQGCKSLHLKLERRQLTRTLTVKAVAKMKRGRIARNKIHI